MNNPEQIMEDLTNLKNAIFKSVITTSFDGEQAAASPYTIAEILMKYTKNEHALFLILMDYAHDTLIPEFLEAINEMNIDGIRKDEK